MKVFSIYTKIFKKYAVIILMYVGIFLGIALAISSSNESTNNDFTEVKVGVHLKNLDDESILSTGLVEYLNKYVNYVDVDEENISDALYFRKISAYIVIPKNFEDEFLNGGNVQIVQERIEENVTSIAIDRAINKYLNYIRVYINQTNEDMELENIVNYVNNVLENEVEAITLIEKSDQLTNSGFYYRSLSYIVIAVILTVVGLITIAFRKFEVRRRVIVSPYPIKKANLEMILGNLIFVVFLVILLCGVSFLIYPESMMKLNGLLLLINTFVFALAALSMSYFMSLLIRKEQVLSGVNNVFSLGSAFLTGAFVPQALLSSGILAFAHVFPNFYFVYNVDLITSTYNLSAANMNTIILYFIIQVLFSAVFVVLSIFLSRKQARSES